MTTRNRILYLPTDVLLQGTKFGRIELGVDNDETMCLPHSFPPPLLLLSPEGKYLNMRENGSQNSAKFMVDDDVLNYGAYERIPYKDTT